MIFTIAISPGQDDSRPKSTAALDGLKRGQPQSCASFPSNGVRQTPAQAIFCSRMPTLAVAAGGGGSQLIPVPPSAALAYTVSCRHSARFSFFFLAAVGVSRSCAVRRSWTSSQATRAAPRAKTRAIRPRPIAPQRRTASINQSAKSEHIGRVCTVVSASLDAICE